MKKVDIITSSSLSVGIGPVQTIKRIIKNHDYFQMQGYEVAVFSADNIGLSFIAEAKKKNNMFISKLKEIARFFALNSRIYSAIRIQLMFKSSHRILRYYEDLSRNPDIIVFHSLMDCYIYLKNYKITGTKVALFTHSDGLMFDMLLSYFPKLRGTYVDKKLQKIASFIMDNVDVKPCIAKIEEKNLLKDFPQLVGKTCLVVNGIDDLSESQLQEIEDYRAVQYKWKYRVVCSGSINGRKGQRLMVEAFSKLPESVQKDIHLLFIGNGPEKATLENRVEQLKLSEHISFTGLIPNTEVYKRLAESNIFMLVSKMEGLPIAIIEALRASLAVVSTNVSGIPEQIDNGVNGLLIEPTVDDVYRVFCELGNYDWIEMGKASRIKYENEYTFDRMRANYVSMLNKAFSVE